MRAVVWWMAAVCFAGTSGAGAAAPPHLDPRSITLELKGAAAAQVFELLGQVSDRRVVVPACAAKATVDLNLTAPIPLVWEVLAAELDVSYFSEVEIVYVVCRPDGDDRADRDELMTRPVRVDVRDASASAALAALAEEAGLSGGDYEAIETTLTLGVDGVPLGTALEVLREAADVAEFRVEDGRLVADMVQVLDPGRVVPSSRAAMRTRTIETVRAAVSDLDRCRTGFDRRLRLLLAFDAEAHIVRADVGPDGWYGDRPGECLREVVGAWAMSRAGSDVVAVAVHPLRLAARGAGDVEAPAESGSP